MGENGYEEVVVDRVVTGEMESKQTWTVLASCQHARPGISSFLNVTSLI